MVEDGEKIQLSVVMPCLNEDETVGICVKKALGWMADNGVQGEVVVADNGSRDGSVKVAAAAGARVISVGDRGYGSALMGGIQAASGEWVIMGDADDSYDFSRLESFWERLQSGADLVMGNRFIGGIRTGAMPFLHRYVGNPVLSWLGRLFYKSPVGDFHCGLRGFRRSKILSLGLSSPGMEFASEMVVKATLEGLDITEVPTTLDPDGRTRAPHLRTWRDGFRHLQFLLLHAPRWLFLYPGIVLVVTGLVLTGFLVTGPVHLKGVVLDVHTLFYAGIFLLSGTQLMLFSLFARRLRTTSAPSRRSLTLDILHRLLSSNGAYLLALLFLLLGMGMSVTSIVLWGRVRFGDLDPLKMLRMVIPAGIFIFWGLQLGFSAFLYEMIRLKARMGSGHQPAGTVDPGTTRACGKDNLPGDPFRSDSDGV